MNGGGEIATAKPNFVGRARELTEILAALAGLASGRGQLVLVSGEAGIGKSFLADEVARAAARGGTQVCWGRCWEGSGAPAYWPWIQIVRSLLRDRPGEWLASRLGSGAIDIARFIPEVRELLADAPPLPLEGDEARFRLFDATTVFLRNVATAQPIVLIFDDLHAADMSSLLLLQFVCRALRDTPLLILALYRDADVRGTEGLAEIFGELAREGHRLSLGGFSTSDVAELIAHRLSVEAPAIAAVIHRRTGGNPFFVDVVTRWLVNDGVPDATEGESAPELRIPDDLCDLVRWRLHTLPGEPQPPAPVDHPPGHPVPPVVPRLGAERQAALQRRAYELGRDLAEQRDLGPLLSLAAAECRELVAAEGVAVLLLDDASSELYFPYVAEEKPYVAERLRQIRFPADRGFAGATLRLQVPLRVDDVTSDPRFYAGVDALTGRQTRSLLSAPLICDARAIGVIQAVNARSPQGFTDDDLSLLNAVARSIADAIQRVRATLPNRPQANVFRKQGDFWVVAYQGSAPVRLKDAKGLAFIAYLLRHPAQEVHAVDLVRAHASGPTDDVGGTAGASSHTRDDGLRRRGVDAGEETLDAEARAAYRRRLADARGELEEARACNDPGRVQRAEHEIEFLTAELTRAVGLGGRARRTGSHSERARVNVTRAITLVVKRIEANNPALAEHLSRTLHTGTFCEYTPDPRVPIVWDA